MVDPWAYVGPYYDEAALQGEAVFAQVRWAEDWTMTVAWSAQGEVFANTVVTDRGDHLWILEGDLNAPVQGGPFGRYRFPMSFPFAPMHLRVEHNASEGTTQATVVDVNENRTQVMDNPVLNPWLQQIWTPDQGNPGSIGIAFFDRWEILEIPVTSLVKVMHFFREEIVPPSP